jgi:hypothetical protein
MNELENALAWFKPAPSSWLNAASKNMEALGQWIWEVIQGDFNAEQSTGQIVTGTVTKLLESNVTQLNIRSPDAEKMK